jgi:adenylosuccinate synthase
MRKSAYLNSLSGLCLTKLDVLDGLPSIGLCVAYRYGGREVDTIPHGAESYAKCQPVIETLPGWTVNTSGVRTMEELPDAARRYIRRIEELVGVPVDVLSTGPDRQETIVLRNPFA